MNAWCKFIEGNNDALALIYETYYKRMCAYGIAIGFCEYICKDAAQDVFCAICDSKGKLEHVDNVESYLLHCMKNRLFDIHNAEQKIICISCDNLIVDQEANLIGKIINAEKQLLIKEELGRLYIKLNPKQKKVLFCRYFHNLKFKEIAVIMNMSPTAVKSLLYRTLKIMKQESEASSTRRNPFSDFLI